jgi:heat shock protein HtpX
VNFVEQQRRNRWRTVLLIGAFVALFVALGLLLDLTVVGAPLPIATVTALVVATATSLLGWRRGADWVLASLLAEPLRDDDPEHQQLANIVTEMSLAAGLPRPRLFVIPDPSPNALAAGATPGDAAIAVTAGALALLDREETQGVVAHEMAHLANRDTAVMTMVSVLFGGLLMLADWARRSLFFARQGSRAINPLAFVVLPLLVLLTPLLSRLLAMAVSRRREYLADATAVELTRNPEGLARALEKIAGSEFPLRAATRGSAHLFIVSPLRRRPDDADNAWSGLFATHPPLAQRVALLRGLES